MINRMLIRDFLRNKVVTVTLLLFIMLAALLTSGATIIISELLGSVEALFKKADIPHFVQMHRGDIDRTAIERFAVQNSNVISNWQIVELLNINGADIILGENTASEADSIMENSFVKQNPYFDFLLDTDNQIIRLNEGEIAVPIYHRQQYGLNIGDTVKISSGSVNMEFTIKAFIRDAQMNPSIITSKRFLISDSQWEIMSEALSEKEYLIEFKLHDVNRSGSFESMYLNAGLPQTGPSLTHSLFRLMNSVTDGIVAAVIILIGVFLVVIAVLCLRFTMITSIEEDYREIGVLKAIGVSAKDIRELYMRKYVFLAAAASAAGYIISLLAGNVFTANIALYMGRAEKTILKSLLPVLGAALIFLTVAGFCRLVLRRFQGISAVQAIRTGSSENGVSGMKGLKLYKSRFPDINIFLGVREVLGRFRVYGLLFFVFVISAFLMIAPLNMFTTVKSPRFITYMGAGQSDIRIDLQHTGGDMAQFNNILNYIKNDTGAEKYSEFVTSTFKALSDEGVYENIRIEIGDFSVFPLEYSAGTAPLRENEIALSVMNADEFSKNVGDTLEVLVNGEARHLTVTGIYQDVTNGGRTAKALLPHDPGSVISYTVNINVIHGVSVPSKIEEYAAVFYPAKVTGIENYISQTLGGIIGQLETSVWFAAGITTGISALITAMFFKMLTAKDATQIAIMRGLGFSAKDIYTQYASRALIVLLTGIVTGTLAAATLGQGLAGLIIPGVSSLKFIVNPLAAYLLCPAALIASVLITLKFINIKMKKISGFIIAAE